MPWTGMYKIMAIVMFYVLFTVKKIVSLSFLMHLEWTILKQKRGTNPWLKHG